MILASDLVISWFGTVYELRSLSGSTARPEEPLFESKVAPISLLATSGGGVWSVEPNAAQYYDGRRWKKFDYSRYGSYSGAAIDATIAGDNTLFILLDEGTVLTLNGHDVLVYPRLAPNGGFLQRRTLSGEVMVVAPVEPGAFVFREGTWSFEASGVPFQGSIPASRRVRSAKIHRGAMYVVLEGKGLFKLEAGQWIELKDGSKGIEGDLQYDTHRGVFWIKSESMVRRFEPDTGKWVAWTFSELGLPNDMDFSLLELTPEHTRIRTPNILLEFSDSKWVKHSVVPQAGLLRYVESSTGSWGVVKAKVGPAQRLTLRPLQEAAISIFVIMLFLPFLGSKRSKIAVA